MFNIMKKGVLSLLLLSSLCTYANVGENQEFKPEVNFVQQEKKLISGVVVDKNGDPIIGANVIEKGTTNGTITDLDGHFSLSVSKNSVLVVSYIGYLDQEISSLNNLSRIVLVEDSKLLDEVVVVGYGTMKKSDLTGSVQRVDAKQYEMQANTNLLGMLNGSVAGVFLSEQSTTAEGGGKMQLRGQKSIQASNEPLLVVDGVIFQGSVQDINPADIESIDVLKDASSAAVFGARSASGVLIITTKKGKSGKPTINFSTKLGFSDVTKELRPAGPEEYLSMKEAYRYRMNPNAPKGYYTNPENLPEGVSLDEWMNYDPHNNGDPTLTWLNRITLSPAEQNNYLKGITTDWYDDTIRKGFRQDYNVSLSGGTDNLSYYWSSGYTKNQGIILGDDYSVFRSRLNLSANVTDYLKVGLNAQFSNEDKSTTPMDITRVIRMSPYLTRFNENGEEMIYPNDDITLENPYIYYKYRDKFLKTQSLFATITADLKLPLGFSYNLAFTNRFAWSKDYYFDSLKTPNGMNNNGFGSRKNFSLYEYSLDNILKWNKTFLDKHSFDFTFLFNIEKYQSWEDVQTNSGFSPSGTLSFHGMQFATNPKLVNNDEYSTGVAFMTRLNYSFMNKYLLTASYRRDGYSAFGLNNPYSNFFSAALGWNIAEEKFFNKDLFDQLKLRVSWGTNGNREIGRYEALAKLDTSKYLYNTSSVIGVYTSKMANNDLKWERTQSINFGVDFSLFNSRIYGSLDAYLMTTKDVLLNRTLPIIIGYSNVMSNLGELKNNGMELSLNSVNIRTPKFEWNSSFTLSFNRNKISHLYGDMIDVLDEKGNVIGKREADDPTNGWFIGKSIDRIWDYEILGVYQDNEVEEAKKYGKQPGDFKLRDVNNDGKLTPEDDKVFQGYKTPRFRLGLRNSFRLFNNVELSFFLRSDLGVYAKNNERKNLNELGQFERTNWYKLPYWTPGSGENKWARMASNASAPSFDVWERASFVRLQELTIAYNFPKTILNKMNLTNLRLYFNAHNLFTISGWSLWDPESHTLPMPKTYTFGLNLTI